MNNLRDLPSVEQLLQTNTVSGWISEYGRPLTLHAIRSILDQIRSEYRNGTEIPDHETLLDRMQRRLSSWIHPTLIPVINATGVVLHTNLGRAPLSRAAIQAIQDVSSGYSNLEYDLDKGQRGSRSLHAEDLLRQITGAEAALVVNNNSSAVMLVLTVLARGLGVLIARSQLVEIGGGFRVPEVMKQSGAELIEVGTTNRVHLYDYEQAIHEQTVALVMRAHRSNFQIIGFTSEPDLGEIVQLSHDANIPVVDDLGSGSLLDTSIYGLSREPMVQESLSAGADLVCFSGDKLLGGPQAGVIIGKAESVAKLKKHPLARAIRADKLCLSALSATLIHYLKDEAEREIPIWQMIASSADTIQTQAEAWKRRLGQGMVITGESTIGGGSLPGETLPTFLLALKVSSTNQMLSRMRASTPPIIARTHEDMVLLDPRTVLPGQEDNLLTNLADILKVI